MLTKEPIKEAQQTIAELQKVYENLYLFADTSELALVLCLERFGTRTNLTPKARWQYCRQTARELMRWKDAFEDYLEQSWVDVSEEYNEEEGEWESNSVPHFALSSRGYLIDTVLQEIITLPHGAVKLLESMDEDAYVAGLRLNQIIALHNGALAPKANRDPRKARTPRERRRIEADTRLWIRWKEYKFYRRQRAEEYLRQMQEG